MNRQLTKYKRSHKKKIKIFLTSLITKEMQIKERHNIFPGQKLACLIASNAGEVYREISIHIHC